MGNIDAGVAPHSVDQLLDAIKARFNLDTDYKLAKHLKVRVQVISNYRNKKSLPDEAMAIRLADEIGLPRAYVLACVAAERAELGERFEIASTWRALAAKMGVTALVVLVSVQVALLVGVEIPQPDQWAALVFAFTNDIHYAKWLIVGAVLAIGVYLRYRRRPEQQ